MHRIDERTVELTAAEEATADLFNDYLDRGHGIPFAAMLALKRHAMNCGMPSDEFIAYLSDDTCERWGSSVRRKPEWSEGR